MGKTNFFWVYNTKRKHWWIQYITPMEKLENFKNLKKYNKKLLYERKSLDSQ